ncbi:lipopolysaccharide heptosyltransferase II [Campylobacter fetus]|uniref:lipopolysaccharide heptosyltransferase II n=1 Tax=Campylobacter fetus TaxID=196 RepID=UPI00138E53BD|nr:lipopolysaccharide heptosyltransferase II [Campylobacter fetus]
MRILIELPTWLGDAVMVSAAVQSLALNYPNCKITFFGSEISTSIYSSYPNCENIIIDNSKKAKFRLFYLLKTALNLDKFDIAVSFRSHFYSKVFFKFIKADKKAIFTPTKNEIHQVQKYMNFIINCLSLKQSIDELKLYFAPFKFKNKTLGLNPGASYGSAKRWYPQYFADVAINLKKSYEVVIFGGKNEQNICDEIALELEKNGVKYQNLCNKTTICELASFIAGLDMFITNDSGPMHIAAAFKVPTIALFGPTKFKETSPYKNNNAKILHLDLDCMPCMKRVCPLNSHECMKNLTPKMVLDAIYKLNPQLDK